MKREPENWSYWNTLGVAYYRADRFQDAVNALESSMKGKSGDADGFDLYFLAMSHSRLGETAKARVAWARARAWHVRQEKHLSREESEELQGFRSEAEKVLGPNTTLKAGSIPWVFGF